MQVKANVQVFVRRTLIAYELPIPESWPKLAESCAQTQPHDSCHSWALPRT